MIELGDERVDLRAEHKGARKGAVGSLSPCGGSDCHFLPDQRDQRRRLNKRGACFAEVDEPRALGDADSCGAFERGADDRPIGVDNAECIEVRQRIDDTLELRVARIAFDGHGDEVQGAGS